jgi:broad specificity phosphatase PhoE
MRIILIRHGESVSDVENRYGGAFDDKLTAKGEAQARKLSEKVSRKGIEIIYSSNLSRARETAEIIGKHLDRPIQSIESMRERNFYGILTGLRKDEAAKKFPEEVKKLTLYRNTIHSGETYDEFRTRIIFSIDNISRGNHKIVAIVTHGGPISCIVRELLKLGEFKKIGDCAYFDINYDGKYRLVGYENAEFEKPPKID